MVADDKGPRGAPGDPYEDGRSPGPRPLTAPRLKSEAHRARDYQENAPGTNRRQGV